MLNIVLMKVNNRKKQLQCTTITLNMSYLAISYIRLIFCRIRPVTNKYKHKKR